MLTKFKVENFKSIHSLELELGRVNVFIGENGSGKSNVLEAVALASAAANMKLGSDELAAKGIRITNPRFFRAAFEDGFQNRSISISAESSGNGKVSFEFNHTNDEFSGWTSKNKMSGFPIRLAEAIEILTTDKSNDILIEE